jgi:hypothetical protein
MTNEDKILSMLDITAAQTTTSTQQLTTLTQQVATLTETSVTKDEFNGFREQVCDHLDKHETENNAAHETSWSLARQYWLSWTARLLP